MYLRFKGEKMDDKKVGLIKQKLTKTNKKLKDLFNIVMLDEKNNYKFENFVNKENYNPDYKNGFYKRYFLTLFTKKKCFNLNEKSYKKIAKQRKLFLMSEAIFMPFFFFLSQKNLMLTSLAALFIFFLSALIFFLLNTEFFENDLKEKNLAIEKNIKNNSFENIKKVFFEDNIYLYDEKSYFEGVVLDKEQLISFFSFIREHRNDDEINKILENKGLEVIEDPMSIYKILIDIQERYQDELENIKNENELSETTKNIRKRNKIVLDNLQKVNLKEEIKNNS